MTADFTSQTNRGASPNNSKNVFSAINAIMDKYGIHEEQVDDMSKHDPYGKPDMRDNESEKPNNN